MMVEGMLVQLYRCKLLPVGRRQHKVKRKQADWRVGCGNVQEMAIGEKEQKQGEMKNSHFDINTQQHAPKTLP